MSGAIKSDEKKSLIWNYCSVAIMALSGLVFNLLIQALYDASILGVFNLAYSYYIVLSQVSTCGLHMAVLKVVSDNRNDTRKSKETLSSALLAVLITGVSIVCLSELLLGAFHFDMQRKVAIASILPALLFFSINKVLLNYLNARVEMVGYAIFQGLRNILICAAIVLLGFLKVEGEYLTYAFLIAEITLMVMLLFFIIRKEGLFEKPSAAVLRQLISFGLKILPSNIVLELNTKVDVLCLGWIIKDNALIGVYSFVSVFAEGFYQVYMVIRRHINPYLSEWRTNKERWDLMLRKLKTVCLAASIPLVIVFSFAYYVVIHFFDKAVFINGMVPLIILLGSISLNGVFIIYGNVMSQLGKPLKESVANTITVAVNFILNIVLILCWGITGAAIATAVSYCCYSLFIYSFLKRSM